MVRVLFWNINKKPLAEALRQLCDIYDVDILVLAENAMHQVDLLTVLNQGAERIFNTPKNLSKRICIITDINGKSLLHNGRPAREFSDHLPVTFTVRT